MESKLQCESTQTFRHVFCGTVLCEETSEAIVPDEKPDIGEILFTEGIPFLRSKDVADGRVKASGVVKVSVLYRSDPEGEIAVTNLEVPFSVDVHCEDADSTCKLVVGVRLAACTSRTLNSRKVLARAEAAVVLRAWRSYELITSCQPTQDMMDLEIQTLKLKTMLPTAISERSFVITESCDLPAAKPPITELLLQQPYLRMDSAKQVGSKLIVKGTAGAFVLYRSQSEQLPCATEITTEFSQIIETDVNGSEDGADVTIALTGAFFQTEASLSPEERQISMELHVAAQCVTYTTQELEYVTDLYSNLHPCVCQTEALQLYCKNMTAPIGLSLRGSVPCSSGKDVLYATARVGREESPDHGETLECIVEAAALVLRQDGSLGGASGKLKLQQSECAIRGDFSGQVQLGQVSAVPGQESLEFRVPIEFAVTGEEAQKIEIVKSVSVNRETTLHFTEEPSVVVHRFTEEDDMWQLARQYHSKVSDIYYSGAEDNCSPEPGKLIIIPKQRA